MIHITRATDLWLKPYLASTMFTDRGLQFRDRLGWDVRVDTCGHERDEYDNENPIYIIIEDKQGRHAGSMRLLPTTGKTMINDHFTDTLSGNKFHDTKVWECTRFCLAPRIRGNIALRLLLVGAKLIQEARLERLIAIFDQRMIRMYNRQGVAPEIIGAHDYSGGKVIAGYWYFNQLKYSKLLKDAHIDPVELELLFANVDLPWVQRIAS